MVRRIALVLGGLVLGLALCEIALRAVTRPEDLPQTPLRIEHGRWIAHPFLPYAGVRGADYTLQDRQADGSLRFERVRNNDYGFRSHDFPLEKSPEDFFVVCLGGSTTYGRRVESNALTWPELLEARLAERYPERRVRVFNLGVDRATTAVSVVTMATVATHIEPDLVIVYHGFNDLVAMGTEDHRSDHAHFYRDLDPARVWRGVQRSLPAALLSSYVIHRGAFEIDRLLRLNDLAAEVGLPRRDASDPFRGFDTMVANLRTIRSIAAGQGADVLFSTFQFRDGDEPVYAELNQRLRGFFEAEGVAWVDQAALIPDHSDEINIDVCHFTQRGREMMAENFLERIVQDGRLE